MFRTELVVDSLRIARSALEENVCYGQVFNLQLPHKRLPNGYPVRVRVAVGPDVLICRATNIGRDSKIFDKVARSFLDYITKQMGGWKVEHNSRGTGGGKVFWLERIYKPLSKKAHHARFDTLLDAVSQARLACVRRSKFEKRSTARWQSPYVDNGIYPVEWTIKARGVEVIVELKNKGPDSDAFMRLADWVFRYVMKHNQDGRGRRKLHGVALKIFSETLMLEVPCG